MRKRNVAAIGALAIFLVAGINFLITNSQQNNAEHAFNEISDGLWTMDYPIRSISFRPDKREVTVRISDQGPTLSDAEERITNYIKTAFKARKMMDISVVVKTIDIKQVTMERKWMSVIPQIDKKLKSLSDRYTGIAIDFNPKPINYSLKTSYSHSGFNEDELKDWMELTKQVIVSHKLPGLLKKDEVYVIKIIGKNNKVLLREIFWKNVD